MSASGSATWPHLPIDRWEASRDTVHMWTQIVGKIRLALTRRINHWWNVPLYVSTRGLTTGVMPYDNRSVEIEFDLCDHVLRVMTSDPDERRVQLEPKSVATFYEEVMSALGSLGIDIDIYARPVEVEEAIPFADDYKHDTYQPEEVQTFWRILVHANQVFLNFRSRFIGKVSQVNFFWGGFDLAVTRFSGRLAPEHPGGFPNVGDWVMKEAYSHEVSSAGYWPGGGPEGIFFSYAYPEPAGFKEAHVSIAGARYDEELGEWVLPYEVVRTADAGDELLLGFLQQTYEAAADRAGWDRESLERSST